MPFRLEYIEALKLLAGAFEEVVAKGHAWPVLVGGAAVEFYTGGAITSGDFDVVTPSEEALETALLARGFRAEDRKGWLQRGYYHPEFAIGVEIVGRSLFEGRGDPSRTMLVEVMPEARVAIVAPEDLIADRMGQFASTPQRVPEMLEQAALILKLAVDYDEDYLEKRIRQETSGEYDLAFLQPKANQ